MYGSQLSNPNIQRDVDLVLVCEDEEKDRVAQKLARIQEGFPFLLHAIFVYRSDIKENPQLRKLIRGARPLW
jgi:hypothetical protein